MVVEIEDFYFVIDGKKIVEGIVSPYVTRFMAGLGGDRGGGRVRVTKAGFRAAE